MAEATETTSTKEDEEDCGPTIRKIVAYLESDKGHEMAQKLITTFHTLRSTGGAEATRLATHRFWGQVALVAIGMIAAGVLSYSGKFTSEFGVLIGTMIGYAYGNRE